MQELHGKATRARYRVVLHHVIDKLLNELCIRRSGVERGHLMPEPEDGTSTW